jgi:peptidyl-prolyl cis-trans isomerase D
MISWIQRYFQKHFRLVFIVVLIAIGLPMVVIYSAGGGGNSHSIKALERPFFNINLDNPEQNQRLGRDAELSVLLRVGYPALQASQLRQYGLNRVAALALAEQLHLPPPTADQVSKHVLTLRAFQNQEGQFDQSAYTRFGDEIKAGRIPFAMADVNRVMRDDALINNVLALASGPGYVLPTDVKLQLSRVDSTWSVQIASLDYPSFNPSLSPTDDTLKKFQADNSFRYDVPARPRVSLIEFKTADFPPPRAATEAELRNFYNANLASFPVPAEADKKDAAAPATPVDNFPKVRAQVEAALNEAVSRRLASEAANKLTVALYEHRTTAPANSPALAQFLSGLRHPPVALPSFAPAHPPADRAWLARYAGALSGLTRERFFTDPLASPDGYIVLLWNEDLPGYTPALAEVRDRVLADYKESEKRRLFIERGQALKAQLQAAAKSPTGFADKAAAEKLEVKSYANFTLRTAPQDFPRNALEALSLLDQGQVSDMIATEEGKGLLVFAQAKKLPDLTPANPRYAETQAQFAALLASNSENSVLGELVEEELKKTSSPAAATP